MKKTSKKKVNLTYEDKLELFESDLYNAMDKWIMSGRKISSCLGDFYVNTRNRTVFCNPFAALIVQNKIKIRCVYLSGRDIDYDSTIRNTLAQAYGLPNIFVRGYERGFVSPAMTSKEYLKGYLPVSENDLDVLHDGAKRGQSLALATSHILYNVYNDG
jgi:hypothetical protein